MRSSRQADYLICSLHRASMLLWRIIEKFLFCFSQSPNILFFIIYPEDSELDYGSRQLPPNICGANPNCSTGSPTQVCTTDQFTYGNTAYSVPPYRKVPLSPGTILSPSYGADAYDASSSDSGFEEVTVSCSEETIPPIKNRGSNTATDGVYTMQSFKAYLE